MTGDEEDHVALRLLHTADWHLGAPFQSFPERYRTKLKRARLDVLDDIFGTADRERVDAVLCAGDLFDAPEPGDAWWKAVLKKLNALAWGAHRPIFLLPGNHDPLLSTSVWAPSHPFRQGLPDFVKVIDRPGFEASLGENAVLYASPCEAVSSSKDLALELPKRAPDDDRIRVGMVHGMTFDFDGHQSNYPVAKDVAADRGFDYLALGDTHSFRDKASPGKPPMVYPGAPEPTSFGEKDAGNVVLVFITRRRRVRFERKPVARWRWRTEKVDTIEGLRRLAQDDLRQTVLRLQLSGALQPDAFHEAENILEALAGDELSDGAAGALLREGDIDLDPGDVTTFFAESPEEIRLAAAKLEEVRSGGGHEGEVAERALMKLYRLARSA